MIFGIKENHNFDPYSVFLAIATNIPQRLKTGFVVQGHISLEIKWLPVTSDLWGSYKTVFGAFMIVCMINAQVWFNRSLVGEYEKAFFLTLIRSIFMLMLVNHC